VPEIDTGRGHDDDKIRIVIADSDPMARRALRDALQQEGIVVVAEATTGTEAVELVLFYSPDVVLLDERLSGLDGMAATRTIRDRSHAVAIVVLAAAPDDLDGHRRGLKAARQDRLELLSRTTTRLTARLDAAAARANTKVLMHPGKSRDVVHSSNHVGTAVGEFHSRLGISSGRQSVEARPWAEAAAQVRATALETSGDGVDAVWRLGMGTVRTAKSMGGGVSRRVGERPFLRRGPSAVSDEQV